MVIKETKPHEKITLTIYKIFLNYFQIVVFWIRFRNFIHDLYISNFLKIKYQRIYLKKE